MNEVYKKFYLCDFASETAWIRDVLPFNFNGLPSLNQVTTCPRRVVEHSKTHLPLTFPVWVLSCDANSKICSTRQQFSKIIDSYNSLVC